MKQKIVDLTALMYEGAPTMPMDPKMSITEHCNLRTLGYNLARVTFSTHQGTHMDAPYHFFDDGITVDQVGLDRCVVRAVAADLTRKKPREPITVEDILPYGKFIDSGKCILFNTGWDKVFPRPEFFSDFPFMTCELAEWLAEKKTGLVGMDIPTPNGTDWKLIHETLLGAGVLVVEGLANIGDAGAGEFTFIALPLKLKGRDGSPVRAMAILDP